MAHHLAVLFKHNANKVCIPWSTNIDMRIIRARFLEGYTAYGSSDADGLALRFVLNNALDIGISVPRSLPILRPAVLLLDVLAYESECRRMCGREYVDSRRAAAGRPREASLGRGYMPIERRPSKTCRVLNVRYFPEKYQLYRNFSPCRETAYHVFTGWRVLKMSLGGN